MKMSVIAMSIDDNTLNNINSSTNSISLNSLNICDSLLLRNKMENRINIPHQIIQTSTQPITLQPTISITQPAQQQIIKVIQVAQPPHNAPTAPAQNVYLNSTATAHPSSITANQALNIPIANPIKRRLSIPNLLETQGPSPSQPRRLSIQLNEVPIPNTNPDSMAIDPKPQSVHVTQNTTTTQHAVVAAPTQIHYIYGIPRAPSLPINNIVPVTMSPIQPLKAFPALPLSNFVVYLVNRIWYHGKPECRNTAQPKYAELTKFVENVLKVTDLSLNTVLLSLRYIYMLRQKCVTDQEILEWSLRDLISVHFMLANKFLSDDRYSNSVWAEVTGKDLDEMNGLEKKSLKILQFNLNVREEDFKSWEKSISNLGKELRQRMTTLQQERNLKKQHAELCALLNETMSNTNIIKMPLFHQNSPSISTIVVNNVPAIPINPGAPTINIINSHPGAASITSNPAIITTNTQVAPTLAASSLNLKFAPQTANIAVVNTANPTQVATVTNVANVAAITQNPIPLNAVTLKRAVSTSPKVSITPMYLSSSTPGLTVVNPTSSVGTINTNSIYPSPPLCRISTTQPAAAVLATPNFVGPATVALVSTNGEVSSVNANPSINTLTTDTSTSTLFAPQTIQTNTLISPNGNININTANPASTLNVTTNNCRFLKHSLSSTSLKSLQQSQTNYNSPLSQHHLTTVSGNRLKTSNSSISLSSFKNGVFKNQTQNMINHTATINNLNELNLPINRIPTPLNYSSPKKMRFSTGVTTSASTVFIKEASVGVPSILTTSPLNGITQVQLPVAANTTINQGPTIIKSDGMTEQAIKLIPTNKPMFY